MPPDIAVAASVRGRGRERAFGLNDAQSHALRDAVLFADRNQVALQVEVQRDLLMQIALLQQSGLDFLVLVIFLYGFRFLSRLGRHLDGLVCTVVLCDQQNRLSLQHGRLWRGFGCRFGCPPCQCYDAGRGHRQHGRCDRQLDSQDAAAASSPFHSGHDTLSSFVFSGVAQNGARSNGFIRRMASASSRGLLMPYSSASIAIRLL